MFQRSFTFSIADRTQLFSLMSLMILLSGTLPLAASPPESCRGAVPLSLEHPIPGHATPQVPVYYVFEAQARTFLVTEAHASSFSPMPPKVRLLDHFCRPLASNLPISPLQGRHIHRIEKASTYFVEVTSTGPLSSDFELTTWLTQEVQPVAGPLEHAFLELLEPTGEMSESDEEEEPSEPLDEWIEARTGPLPALPTSWLEVAGHGLVEMESKTGGDGQVRFHALCPWARRPELFSTYTCSRQLRVKESGMTEIRLLTTGGPEIVGLNMVRAGRLTLDGNGGTAHLMDARGQMVTGWTPGEAIELEAKHYYLRVEPFAGVDVLRLDVELD